MHRIGAVVSPNLSNTSTLKRPSNAGIARIGISIRLPLGISELHVKFLTQQTWPACTFHSWFRYARFRVVSCVCNMHGKQGGPACYPKQTSTVCPRKLVHMAIPSKHGRFPGLKPMHLVFLKPTNQSNMFSLSSEWIWAEPWFKIEPQLNLTNQQWIVQALKSLCF